MWRAPFRPRESDISQSYNDGLVDIYRETDTAPAGYAPRPAPVKVGTLAFAEQRLGVQRYYSAAQNQLQLERVLRVPKGFRVDSQMVAVVRGAETRYRIDLVQTVPDVYPASLDLTLSRIVQQLPREGGEGDDVV